jgi:hypothetical protein
MNALRALRAALLAVAFVASAPAQAISYQDMWWTPSESGWGLNLTQQGDTVFAIWFVYESNGRGIWYVASCPLIDDRTCRGDLYATTGPAYTAPAFDPKRVTETVVGSATFDFTDANHGVLTYTVSGASVRKNIVRFSYAEPPIAGTYWIAGQGLASGCGASGTPYTYTYDNAGLVLGVSGNRLDLAFKLYNEADWNTRYSCTAAGAFAHWGSMVAFDAPFACTDGRAGSLSIADLSVSDRGLTARLSWDYGTCVESENVAGIRHPEAPVSGPGSIALGAANYTVSENGGTVTATVLRTGGRSGRVGIGYTLVDGTATGGRDYAAMTGNVVFEDGDSSAKSIDIPILDDAAVEGTETFTLALGTPSGGAKLGSPATAAIAIVDDDGGDDTRVGPEGGSVSKGSLTVTVPAGAFGAITPVGIATIAPDKSFTPDATVLTEAFSVTVGGSFDLPISLSAAANGVPAAGETVFAVLFDSKAVGMYDATPRKGIRLVEARYVNGRYEATLPARGAASKAMREKAGSSFTFTIYWIGGYAMRSSTHFNIRYPARTCNSADMDQWLTNAEEAWTLLVDRMMFDPSGLGVSVKRMSIDVVDLSNATGTDVSGGLSYDPWTLGVLDNFNLQFRLPTSRCSSPTPAQQRDMEATIGHEFFHAIQNVYDPAPALIEAIWGSRGLCLYDASSSWFEGEMLGDKTYLGGPSQTASTTFYREGLGRGCRADPQQFGYGMATFLRFLTEKFGSDLVLSIWTQVRNGAGYDIPVDAMQKVGVRVAEEWPAFAQKLLLGTGGLGWQVPPVDGTAAYREGSLLRLSGTTPQLSARKYQLDFTSLANATNKSPTCKMTVATGAGQHGATLYQGSPVRGYTTLVDSRRTVDPQFRPTATNDYVLVVTNDQDTALVVDGIRYGQQSPFEVTIDCGAPAPACSNGNWEIGFNVPTIESFSCQLSNTSQQLARLCVSAVNGAVTARGSTCYSNLQSATGTINADGTFTVDFKWGGYNASSLVDGSGPVGEIASGRFTGKMAAGCEMQGTATGTYHAWNSAKPSWCPAGFDVKKAFQSPGSSK